MSLQLDFLSEVHLEYDYKKELQLVKESNEKVRRGIFAKHADLSKKYSELSCRLEILERNICKGK